MQPHIKTRLGPDGILFFNRETGLNLLVDEIKVPKNLWARAPRHVSIALTNACDLSCPHCFAPKYPAELDLDRLLSWIDELDTNGCIGIGFGGGEPTLYSDFVDACTYVVQNTNMAITFTTHGHRIEERLAADLEGKVHFIRVSMDGVGSTYEKIRKRPFSLLLRQLKIIREITHFGINYLVNHQTFPELDAAIEIGAEIGASEFMLIPEQQTIRNGGIDNHTRQMLCKWVQSYDGPISLTVSEPGSEGLPTINPLPKETGLRAYAHIDASGILKRSSYDTYGVPIGAGGIMESLKLLQSMPEVTK